jgi:hypothetical protein
MSVEDEAVADGSSALRLFFFLSPSSAPCAFFFVFFLLSVPMGLNPIGRNLLCEGSASAGTLEPTREAFN